jgi:acyl-CoA reductase-like NAD-dependent aldehyde dehydrogenase
MWLSYPVLIGGVTEPGRGWVHWVRIGDMLEAPYDMTALKAALDVGAPPPGFDRDRVVGRVAMAEADQVTRAVKVARQAQRSWSRLPGAQRLGLVTAFHRVLLRRRTDLVDLLVAEGHPVPVARFELAVMLAAVDPRTVAAVSRMLCHSEIVDGYAVSLIRKPDGVVGVVPARNAPAATLVMSCLMALAAGNAVTVVLPPSAPLAAAFVCHELIAPLLAGHPGIFSALCCPVREVLPRWLSDPAMDDIYYFGPSDRGRALAAECLANGKKPILEMSANDTVVVWHDADLEGARRALLEAFLGSGQICLAPNRAVLHPAIADDLLDLLRQDIDRLPVGRPEREDVILSPVVRRGEFSEVVHEAVNAGAELLTGGEFVDVYGRVKARGPFIRPALLRVNGFAMAAGLRAVCDETFFPLLTAVVPEQPDLDAVIEFLDANRFALRNSLWSNGLDTIASFVAGVGNGGTLKVNHSHVAPMPVLPVDGGGGLTGGPFGEANLPLIRTSHLQGICSPARSRPAVLDSPSCGPVVSTTRSTRTPRGCRPE